jgi:short-subunit dehydrogenase
VGGALARCAGRPPTGPECHCDFEKEEAIMSDITKPAVLITGASTGIGSVYADRFARRGHDLVLVARDAVRLEVVAERLRREAGVTVDTVKADLTDPAELSVVEGRLRDDVRIGVLVNNAGASLHGGFLDQSTDQVTNLIGLNIVALTRLASTVASRYAAAGSGAIVNIASVVGFAPEIGMTVYGATKAFVLFLSQGLHLELGPKGVYVQAVLPSSTRTEIWERSGRDVDALPAVMDVGELVDAALMGFDRRETVTIPPLPEASQWDAYDAARQAMLPNLMQAHAAVRYAPA